MADSSESSLNRLPESLSQNISGCDEIFGILPEFVTSGTVQLTVLKRYKSCWCTTRSQFSPVHLSNTGQLSSLTPLKYQFLRWFPSRSGLECAKIYPVVAEARTNPFIPHLWGLFLINCLNSRRPSHALVNCNLAW